MKYRTLFVFLMFSYFATAQHRLGVSLEVPIDEGTIQMVVYQSEVDFKENKNAVGFKAFPVSGAGRHKTSFDNLKPGFYAVAIFQDVNDNGKLDKNTFGIPKEPYAFSRSPKVKWRAPRYSEIVFELKESMEISLELKKWSKR